MNSLFRKAPVFGYAIAILVGAPVGASAQDVPKEIWGKWTIRRIVPTRTISCWGDPEAKKCSERSSNTPRTPSAGKI